MYSLLLKYKNWFDSRKMYLWYYLNLILNKMSPINIRDLENFYNTFREEVSFVLYVYR